MSEHNEDKAILFSVADGPESIEIYTSDEEGVIDYAQSFPAVYLRGTYWGAEIKLGPFSTRSIYEQIIRQLKGVPTK